MRLKNLTVSVGRFRQHPGRVVSLALLLSLLQPRVVRSEDSVSYKFQNYQEDADRILIRSHYLMGDKTIGDAFRLKVEGLIDSISGASPTGQPAPEGSDQVPLSELEDERKAIIIDASNQFGPQNVTLQYAYSTESDYDSNGVSVSLARDLNQKNTTLQFGYAYTDDSIRALYLEDWQKKKTHDFFAGVTQLIDKNTVFTFNLSYGDISGFINDPYKLVEKNIELLPGLSLPLTFPENRPTHRTKFISYFGLTRHLENLNASIDGSYRYFRDNHGIGSHTFQVEWFQKFGGSFILRPILRWYRQSAADFYYVTLDGTDIDPQEIPSGLAPHYSADYRISEFDAWTYGLKAVFEVNDWLRLDGAVERYEMSGRDGVTSASAYPKATVITVGASAHF
ncbi:MAG: DUF3570 domain-containing protein [Opitutaceae bacterium]